MSMTIDDSRLNDQLARLAKALDIDGGVLLRQEARLFTKQCIGFTPPKTADQGKKAVSRDLSRAFEVVSDEWLSEIGSEHGTGPIDQWVTFKDGRKVNLVWSRIDPSGQGMRAWHHSVRNKHGRISKSHHTWGKNRWTASYVVARPDFDARRKHIQDRVGRAKAGWLPAYSAVGGKAPAWVSKHAGNAPGYVINETNTPTKPSITIQNHAPGISQLAHFVTGAFQVRVKAIARKVRLALKGYGYDMKSGKLIVPGKTKAYE